MPLQAVEFGVVGSREWAWKKLRSTLWPRSNEHNCKQCVFLLLLIVFVEYYLAIKRNGFESVLVLCVFLFFFSFGCATLADGTLVPWPGIEPMPSAVTQVLNHCTPGKPQFCFLHNLLYSCWPLPTFLIMMIILLLYLSKNAPGITQGCFPQLNNEQDYKVCEDPCGTLPQVQKPG